MTDNVKLIYTKLYDNIDCGKEELSVLLGVSVKTIENTIKKFQDPVVYDTKLKRYRFDTLLPKQIPASILLNIFKDNIFNEIIKSDFLTIQEAMTSNSLLMINTETLSALTRRLIESTLAINNNCTLKVLYLSNKDNINNLGEDKYIKPHKIIVTGFTYYLFVSYDKLNHRNIGEFRTFALNGIGSMEPLKYSNDIYKIDKEGNAFGLYDNDRFVFLKLDITCTNYFKREGLFNNSINKLVNQNNDGSTIIKMNYNSDSEIVNLIQKWMPHITIEGNSVLKDNVYNKIKLNYFNFPG